jgi:hypothetical protein
VTGPSDAGASLPPPFKRPATPVPRRQQIKRCAARLGLRRAPFKPDERFRAAQGLRDLKLAEREGFERGQARARLAIARAASWR